jgi:hypothetical protein
MATMTELRTKAKGLGIPTADIRGATSVEELQTLIARAGKVTVRAGKNGSGRPAKKKAAAAKKKSTTTRKPARATSSASSKRAPARTAKRPASAKRTPARAQNDGDLKRNLLDGVDFSETDGWNPRADSLPDRIIRLAKRFRGNRDKIFDELVGEIKTLVPPSTRGGRKRDMDERREMLRYRINRALWDFALQTGQHEKASGRVEYGTGGTGQGLFKRAGSKARTASKPRGAAKATRGRGRPPKSAGGRTNKTTATRKPRRK